MFIQTENSPNPNALKFLPNVPISPAEPIHYSSVDEARGKSNLAVALFAIQNVKAVFFGSDFITITKEDKADWLTLKPEILMTIMDYFVSGYAIFQDTNKQSPIYDKDDLSEIEKQIIEIIETRVRPSVAMDGGDIIYRGFENGIVKLELRGSCSGCPSSLVTLKNGIESMLKHFVPEVEGVEEVE